MPLIDWTADEAEDVRQILADRLERTASLQADAFAVRGGLSPAETRAAVIHELRGILAKLEAAYANA
jgi:hypothetical protein